MLHAWARLLGLLSLIVWVSATVFVATLFVNRTNAVLVSTLSASDDGQQAAAAASPGDDETALYYLRFDMAACGLGVTGSLMLSMVLWCVKRPYGVRFFKSLEDGGTKEEKRVSVVSSCGSKRSSMSASDAGSAGSISGDTVVAVASAAATVVGGAGGDCEKGDGTLKVDGEKQVPNAPLPKPPGGYPKGED